LFVQPVIYSTIGKKRDQKEKEKKKKGKSFEIGRKEKEKDRIGKKKICFHFGLNAYDEIFFFPFFFFFFSLNF
jgi:hypothetical protein